MTNRVSILGAIVCLSLAGFDSALAAGCKYQVQSTDPDTGEKTLVTKAVRVSTLMASVTGSVQFSSVGNQTYLFAGVRAANYFPIPPELNIDLNKSDPEKEMGRYDPRLDEVLEELKASEGFVPAGSTLRITLEDRSVITLEAEKDSAGRSKGWKPQEGDNEGPNFMILSDIGAKYPLDDAVIKALTERKAISMRLESADRYYEFASRMNPQYPLTWGKKNGEQFQEALNCVL